MSRSKVPDIHRRPILHNELHNHQRFIQINRNHQHQLKRDSIRLILRGYEGILRMLSTKRKKKPKRNSSDRVFEAVKSSSSSKSSESYVIKTRHQKQMARGLMIIYNLPSIKPLSPTSNKIPPMNHHYHHPFIILDAVRLLSAYYTMSSFERGRYALC